MYGARSGGGRPRLIADFRLQIADWKTKRRQRRLLLFQSAICNLHLGPIGGIGMGTGTAAGPRVGGAGSVGRVATSGPRFFFHTTTSAARTSTARSSWASSPRAT